MPSRVGASWVTPSLKPFKDWEAAWKKEQEKERLKERDLEHHAAQAFKEKPPVHPYTSFSFSPMLNSILSAAPQPGHASDVKMLSALPSFKKRKAHDTTSPQAALCNLPVLKKLKIGSSLTSYSADSQGSQELLLNIKHFLDGQGLLKELDVEELFAVLDQACLLETLHLNIAFQTTQTHLLCCEHLFHFMDHDVA
ncbi:hypothetical protein H0H87_012273 [Tephrocybe sp. NHM501043]|nr:hypothetical protein H0H87_012273 [Tephrocybe sp. NHM501043]